MVGMISSAPACPSLPHINLCPSPPQIDEGNMVGMISIKDVVHVMLKEHRWASCYCCASFSATPGLGQPDGLVVMLKEHRCAPPAPPLVSCLVRVQFGWLLAMLKAAQVLSGVMRCFASLRNRAACAGMCVAVSGCARGAAQLVASCRAWSRARTQGAHQLAIITSAPDPLNPPYCCYVSQGGGGPHGGVHPGHLLSTRQLRSGPASLLAALAPGPAAAHHACPGQPASQPRRGWVGTTACGACLPCCRCRRRRLQVPEAPPWPAPTRGSAAPRSRLSFAPRPEAPAASLLAAHPPGVP